MNKGNGEGHGGIKLNVPIIQAFPEFEVISDVYRNCPHCNQDSYKYMFVGNELVQVQGFLKDLIIPRNVTALDIYIIVLCENCGAIYNCRKIQRKVKGS